MLEHYDDHTHFLHVQQRVPTVLHDQMDDLTIQQLIMDLILLP